VIKDKGVIIQQVRVQGRGIGGRKPFFLVGELGLAKYYDNYDNLYDIMLIHQITKEGRKMKSKRTLIVIAAVLSLAVLACLGSGQNAAAPLDRLGHPMTPPYWVQPGLYLNTRAPLCRTPGTTLQ